MEKVEVVVIGRPYQGKAIGEALIVSRRDARVLAAIGKVSMSEGYLRRDMVAGPSGKVIDPDDSPRISAAALKAAEESGLSVGDIVGTGKDGRVTKADVDAAIEAKRKQQE